MQMASDSKVATSHSHESATHLRTLIFEFIPGFVGFLVLCVRLLQRPMRKAQGQQ